MWQLIARVTAGEKQFGVAQIRRLKDIFAEVAGDKNSALNRNQFFTSLGRAFPLLMREKKMVFSLFDAFDADNRCAPPRPDAALPPLMLLHALPRTQRRRRL